MKFEVVLKNLDTDRQKLITVEAESKTDAERKLYAYLLRKA